VGAKVKELTARQAASKKAAALKARLDKDPADAKAAADLIRLLLIEMDQPAAAAEHVDAITDPELKAVASLAAKAAKSPDDLDESEAMMLADWYKSQAASATPAGRAAASRRARACYERFLALHAAEDAQRLAAKLALEELGRAAAPASAGAGVKSGRGVDLLALADPAAHTKHGTWDVDKKGGLVSDASQPAKLVIPFDAPEEYDLRVELTRLRGNDTVFLFLPQGEQRFSLQMGANGNHLFTFDVLDGKGWAQQPFSVNLDKVFTNGRRNEVKVEVRTGSVAAYLNGKLITRAKFTMAVTGDGAFDTGPAAIGIGTWDSPTAFHVLEIAEAAAKRKPQGKKTG
jgi:hypothetical protein